MWFDKTYCINLDKRTDRWQRSEEEFKRIGIEVERFKAYEGNNPMLAFNKSQYHVLKQVLNEGHKSSLILEDDVEFRDVSHMNAALSELPSNWDILFLGCNLIGCGGMEFEKPIYYSKHLRKLVDAWQTHAVAYSRGMVEWIVNNFPYHDDQYETEGLMIYDEWLRVNVIKKRMCFVVAPQVALQRPDHSDIWNTHADYSSLFERGNKLLQ